MTEQEKQEIVDRVADQVIKHSSFSQVWQSIEKVHKQQLYIIENQRKIAQQLNLDLEIQ